MPSWWSEPTEKDAYILSWISIIVTAIAAIFGITVYSSTGDSLILIYGSENLVDFISSAIVLWRFNQSSLSSSSREKDDNDDALLRREKRASIGVTIVLTILGFLGLITAIQDLSKGAGDNTIQNLNLILVLSFVSFVIFGILAKFKFHYAKALHSPSLRKDGLCSLIGTVLGFAMFFNALLVASSSSEEGHNGWWWLDPIVALFCAMGALGYGLYGVHKAYVRDGYPIFSCKWWLYGGGNGMNRNNKETVFGGGDLELQEQQLPSQPSSTYNDDSMTGNPASTDPSIGSMSIMYSRSDDEGMSDVVIT